MIEKKPTNCSLKFTPPAEQSSYFSINLYQTLPEGVYVCSIFTTRFAGVTESTESFQNKGLQPLVLIGPDTGISSISVFPSSPRPFFRAGEEG